MNLFARMTVLAMLIGTGVRLLPAARNPRIWFVDSLVKVFPSDLAPVRAPRTGEALAARNQHVHFQAVLRPSRRLTGVTAECGPLQGPGGFRIETVRINPVGLVVVGSSSDNVPAGERVGEAPGWYPDPLIDFPIDLEAGKTRSVWVTVHVPEEALPGEYRGTLTMSAGGREIARAAIRLRVYSAQVPRERSLRVTNWFNSGDRESRQFYGVSEFSEEWWTLIENLARVMADYRQNVIYTPLFHFIRPQFENGIVTYDFSLFDRWVETFRKAGAIGLIEGEHLLGHAGGYNEPLKASVFLVEDGKPVLETLPPDDPRVAPSLEGLLSALNRHLEVKGWKSIYLQHILDEPHGTDPEYYARFAALVRRCLPGVRTVDAIDAEKMPDLLKESSDIWVPQLGRFDDQTDMLRRRLGEGHEVWFYVCLFPRQRYMNRLIDFPLIKTRLLHWLNFRYGFNGFLHWGWNHWAPEPYLDTQPVINMNETLLPAGDASIVYPDRKRRSVFSSIRLEAMRAGIEDFEMLRSLSLRDWAAAKDIASDAVSTFTDYVRDPVVFRRLEKRLLEALSRPGSENGGVK